MKNKLHYYWQIFEDYAYQRLKTFTILDSVETIDYIIDNHVSVSRFGDGEFSIMWEMGVGFQDINPILSARLSEVLRSSGYKHIVCLPYPLQSLGYLNDVARTFWRGFIAHNSWRLLTTIPIKKVFYDTNFTRFYIDWANKSSCSSRIEKIMTIWRGRNVVVVEGYGTRMGVGNNLFCKTLSLRRIICPSTNAFNVYDRIYNYVLENVEKDALILCALGMTATVLAFDLSKKGYQAIDIGHLDIEYEWYLMNVREKCPVLGKSVNECGINHPGVLDSPTYKEQIICTIL